MKLSKGVLLLFLGLFCKVSVAGNSTQVFFFELEIEASEYENAKQVLLNLKSSINVNDATVSNITHTTECTLEGQEKNCMCVSGNTWSSDACEKKKCCRSEPCRLAGADVAVCLPDTRVSMTGVATFLNYSYGDIYDPNNQRTAQYDTINETITQRLRERFSKLPWFDSLIITDFSKGSLIVKYVVNVLGPVKVSQLENVTSGLNDTTLVTKGLVNITAPETPVDIGSSVTVRCTTQEDLGGITWYLTEAQNKTTVITNGVEASLSNVNWTNQVYLQNISGSWKGLVQCEYRRGSIKHTASKTLDVALLPEIDSISDPQFPDCRNQNNKVKVEITCVILNSTENYNVTWSNTILKDLTSTTTTTQGNFIYYKADAMINCADNYESVAVNCTFINIRSQMKKSRTKTVEIPIINKNSLFCAADGVWPMTKSNYTAVRTCSDLAVGQNTRNCSEGQWKDVIPRCVNQDLHSVQQAVQNIHKGIGFISDNANSLFKRLKTTTFVKTVNSFQNIKTYVDIFQEMNVVSVNQSYQWNNSIISDFVNIISNILNDTKPWTNPDDNSNISTNYLRAIEEMMKNSNLSNDKPHIQENAQLIVCNDNIKSVCRLFNANVSTDQNVTVVGFRNLAKIFPTTISNITTTVESETIILSVTSVNRTEGASRVEMKFDYGNQRKRNHKMFCVYWDEALQSWTDQNCKWGGANDPTNCTCDHNSAFTIMMSKDPETLPYMEELTYAGLGVSILSLVLFLLIEFLVWDTVVKSNISSFRHIALVNISVCLLFSYCAFLGSANPKKTQSNWCLILTVVKHFCFLSVFFWMLCLSFVLLHQLIFVFEQLRKRVYLGLSITLGYVSPLLCVAVTFISFEDGKVDKYYSNDTCWLVHESTLSGSIFSFIIPVGTIVVVNMFTLLVVIAKIVTPTVSEAKARNEKDVVKSIIKTIVFLSPVLGITWIFGFFVLALDLTETPYAQIVNYAFTILNSLQGFFILLTNGFGEKKVRDALFKRFRAKQSVHSKADSSTKMTSVVKKQ